MTLAMTQSIDLDPPKYDKGSQKCEPFFIRTID
ncbi:hypothetical protein VCR29J2_400059 [Vibrio coralliirubri]|nr:hypothetical protein VCR29J2_400059 [Vibrio coralliirubri]